MDYNKKSLNRSAIIHSLFHPQFWFSNSSSIPSFESILEVLPLSDLCSDLNTKRAESGYNGDNYKMIVLQN